MAVTQNSLVLLAASAAAELLVRGRWELVHKRALIIGVPDACRHAVGSCVAQYEASSSSITASHASIVASKSRVGQNDCAFSIYSH